MFFWEFSKVLQVFEPFLFYWRLRDLGVLC